MCYLLQSRSGTYCSPCVLPGLACRTSSVWCHGRSTSSKLRGYVRGSSGYRQSSARITALSSAPRCLLMQGKRQGLLQVSGRLQPTTTPAPICISFAIQLLPISIPLAGRANGFIQTTDCYRVEACGEGGGMSLWKTCGFRAMVQLHRLL